MTYENFVKEYGNELDELERVILNPSLRGKMSPLFYDYFKSIVTSKEHLKYYFLANAVLSRLLRSKEKKVLDIGCGFGLKLICLALLGFHKVVGVDISEEMIEGFHKLLGEFPKLDVRVIKGDFLTIDFPSNSYDVVLLQEVISHIRDTQLLLDKMRHVLSPGGIAYITDSNNDLFLLSRMRSRKNWKKSEFGPIDQYVARDGREVDKTSFFEARIRIIRTYYPTLEKRKLELIAKKTKGLWGEEIPEAAREFLATGRISHSASFPYRNPYTGEFPELGINPFKLVKDLKRKGFTCTFVKPAWVYLGDIRGTPRLPVTVARMALPFLKNLPDVLLTFVLPSFEIMAIKSANDRSVTRKTRQG